MKTNVTFLFIFLFFSIGSTTVFAQDSDWKAPKSADAIKNPLAGNSKATAEGKRIYEQMCVLCHGIKGKGNGEAGLTLDKKPANFLAFKVKKETDGVIYWKITNGKSPMAGYEELLTEDQRWQLVNYIRALEK
ncbi:Cytochrome C oxidase, cbb3-type, subunit III [Flavobacterium succinicans]|jgi:mono/diheme cytochrome c family protein|uniref:Cytochrome C oxidase, cbb3-type, subunit III n=1 Tax=Flavobacterium succinicans TaxID=29536 RepID=A0A1I4Z038_9FLAO|nr:MULTISPECIES: cytochrome c [Flavobacterium]OOV29839.1 cytochrome c class I [Flavobacterium sp. LM5]SFN43547.1 Cytochrome C oxidase, cbb3-type, subunit III [Flavobacterium succinicans]